VPAVDTKRLFGQIDSLQTEMVDTLIRLMKVPAIGPETGGEGEIAKANLLLEVLAKVGFDRIERFDAPDNKVPSGKRPNIVAYLNGKAGAKRLWIVTHIDVVPAGEESLWKITKPFEPKLMNGLLYGRGSEDNGQSMMSAIYAAKALKQLSVSLNRTLALAFVSDEEQGSTKGIQHLLSKGLFRHDDLVLVPDSGTPEGTFIEVAEKSILWFKIIVIGRQAHGSLPIQGLNAHRIGMQLALALDTRLHKKYNQSNDQFITESASTFEPTRKDKNVDSINIVPGEDVFFFDCRILPNINVEEVLSYVRKVCIEFEKKTGAKITVEVIQKEPAPNQMDKDAEITNLLKCALKQARGINATVGGVGGGTCAAFFRRNGIPAVVWSTIDEIPHQPDEYAHVINMVEDAKVFALLSLL
jgi:succinyl-diaminopimelate desuccinylase